MSITTGIVDGLSAGEDDVPRVAVVWDKSWGPSNTFDENWDYD